MKIFTKKRIILGIILLVLIIGGASYIFRDKTPEMDVLTVERGDLIQEVSVTGKVQPAKAVNLAFERSGKVYAIYVDVGDQVKSGQLLASLSSGDLLADVQRAEAQVESSKALLEQYLAAVSTQQAKLDELRNGTRPEELAISETRVDSARIAYENAQEKAKIDLENAYGEVVDVINTSYSVGDSALHNQITNLFTDSVFPEFAFVSTDSQAENDTRTYKLKSENLLEELRFDIHTDIKDKETAQISFIKTETMLRATRTFLNRLSDVVNTAAGVDDTTLAAYKTNVNTARTSVNAQLTAINTKRQTIASQEIASQTAVDSARMALKTVQEELALKRAGATAEQITAQEALLRQAEANLASQEAQIKQAQAGAAGYRAQLAKNTIHSPISGIVTKQEAKIGEIATGQTPIISVMSEAKFEIKTNVPEVDIAQIAVENSANVTLDAYDDDVIFEAQVIAINPAETVIEGVSTYKVTLQFNEENELIKSGMTANVDILTDKRENVIAIPGRAIITKDGEKIVRILDGEEITETQVETGIRGLNGRVEILSGIEEGETVIVFMEEE